VNIVFEKNTDHPHYRVMPLLFINLLENAFKHGVENITSEAYVHMSLITENQMLYFSIENNFDPTEVSNTKGIGIKNLKRKLELGYPQKHKLEIINEPTVFKVQLNIDLE
jgi:LytS/YehU family sensor histidine kinase